ncbi:unnamed protein product [Pocillopora meandrina]|uniref:Uncharacterized protein n=1 Tax=Pocillopora meandrina TaxID=46732 RepID=A0AAU9VLB7_9CNID|nr:unnamed protein product [Pocillopora meandrina]
MGEFKPHLDYHQNDVRNVVFFQEGGLTTHKANLITREHGLDKECDLGERIIDTGLHAETEGFEFQDAKEIDIKSVIKSEFSC